MGEPGPHRTAHCLNRRSRVVVLAAAMFAVGLSLCQPVRAADTIAGSAPAAGAADPSPTKIYVLVAVYYMKDGKPFGSRDYGLRIPKTFCSVQKDTLLDRWVTEGNTRMAPDTVWLTRNDYAVKLYCVELKDYDNRTYRQRLLKKPLGK